MGTLHVALSSELALSILGVLVDGSMDDYKMKVSIAFL
jgi:hypothetical protein